MLEPITQRQADLIVKNVLAACKDISKLNRTGYKYISLASGFIAHYDLNGFKSHYENFSLALDIMRFANANQWLNFRPGDNDYEYMQSKARVYQRIVFAIANQ